MGLGAPIALLLEDDEQMSRSAVLLWGLLVRIEIPFGTDDS